LEPLGKTYNGRTQVSLKDTVEHVTVVASHTGLHKLGDASRTVTTIKSAVHSPPGSKGLSSDDTLYLSTRAVLNQRDDFRVETNPSTLQRLNSRHDVKQHHLSTTASLPKGGKKRWLGMGMGMSRSSGKIAIAADTGPTHSDFADEFSGDFSSNTTHMAMGSATTFGKQLQLQVSHPTPSSLYFITRIHYLYEVCST
jgi:hypothetical protein